MKTMFCERLLNAASTQAATGSLLQLMKSLPVRPSVIAAASSVEEEVNEAGNFGFKWIGNTPVDRKDNMSMMTAGIHQPILDFLYPELVVGS